MKQLSLLIPFSFLFYNLSAMNQTLQPQPTAIQTRLDQMIARNGKMLQQVENIEKIITPAITVRSNIIPVICTVDDDRIVEKYENKLSSIQLYKPNFVIFDGRMMSFHNFVNATLQQHQLDKHAHNYEEQKNLIEQRCLKIAQFHMLTQIEKESWR